MRNRATSRTIAYGSIQLPLQCLCDTIDRLQGRVTATNRFLVSGGSTVGALLGGALGEVVGVQATLIIGVLGMMGAFFWVFLSPVRSVRARPEVPV